MKLGGGYRVRPQNQTLNGVCQEILGVETFAEAFEALPENQLLRQDIEALVATCDNDDSRGNANLNKVPTEKIKARNDFIQGLFVSGFSTNSIHQLTNAMDKVEGWGTVSQKTIQRAFPPRA